MQKRIDEFYMKVAEDAAQMSRANRLKVGAVIVKDNNIISFSWNGTPPGWDNTCEENIYATAEDFKRLGDDFLKEFPHVLGYIDADNNDLRLWYKNVTKPEVIHAEQNALFKLARNGGGGNGASMYITHAPCMECAKGIHTSGITRVMYRDVYRSSEGIEFLERCGVEVQKYENI